MPQTNGRSAVHDVYIAVLGPTGSGKTSFISTCSGKDPGTAAGAESRTSGPQEITFMYSEHIRIHLIDTPGFDDIHLGSMHVLRGVEDWLLDPSRGVMKLHGMIFMHGITDHRLGLTRIRNGTLQKLCGGKEFHRFVVLATTMWSDIEHEEVGKKREDELKKTPHFWGYMCSRGYEVRRYDNTRWSGLKFIGHILSQHGDITTCHEEKDLGLEEKIEKLRWDQQRLRERMSTIDTEKKQVQALYEKVLRQQAEDRHQHEKEVQAYQDKINALEAGQSVHEEMIKKRLEEQHEQHRKELETEHVNQEATYLAMQTEQQDDHETEIKAYQDEIHSLSTSLAANEETTKQKLDKQRERYEEELNAQNASRQLLEEQLRREHERYKTESSTSRTEVSHQIQLRMQRSVVDALRTL